MSSNTGASRGIARRDFLKGGAAAALGLGALGSGEPAWSAPAGEPRIKRYKKLGRSGLMMADISFGSSRTSDPEIARHAFQRGVTYFDSAESYKGGDSELAIGKALAGHRDEVILTSKTKCDSDSTGKQLMEALEGSLSRLGTDRIDIYFNHAVNDVERMKNGAWYEFAALARKQGKIRFTGISGHGGQLVECIDHAVEHDLVDVILAGYNFGQDPAFYQRFVSRLDWVAVQVGLPEALARARAKGIGVVAMKTLRGARLNDMRPFERGGASFAQAAFRWVLSSPNVDGLIVSMTDKAQVDEYVAASGAPKLAGAELDLLEQYLLGSRDGYCDHGCKACHASCPGGVAINEVLRTRMYAVDYGDLGYARDEYASLGAAASACVSCSDKPCLGQCPGGLAVGRLTEQAHRLLA